VQKAFWREIGALRGMQPLHPINYLNLLASDQLPSIHQP
jgi:hypothetical protein